MYFFLMQLLPPHFLNGKDELKNHNSFQALPWDNMVTLKLSFILCEVLCLLFPLCFCFFFKCTLLFSLVKYTPLKFSNTYEYPWWGYIIGGFFTLSSTLVVPVWMLYAVSVTPGTVKQVQSHVSTVAKESRYYRQSSYKSHKLKTMKL